MTMSNLPQVKTSSLAVVTCLDLIKILSANPHFFTFFFPVVKPLKMTSRVLNIEGSFHYILKSHQSTFSSSVCTSMDMYQNICVAYILLKATTSILRTLHNFTRKIGRAENKVRDAKW